MELIIDIPEDVYTRLFDNGIQDNEIAVDDVCEMARALRLGIPHETVTEFADRCRECGAKYGKLLKQETSGNLISRQAVFEQINCWIGSGEYRYTNATDYLNKRIKALQAVNPQQKKGHWIGIDGEPHEYYKCDKSVNELKEIREEIAQIKATKIYSTIDLKDMVLEILDRHIKGKVDV